MPRVNIFFLENIDSNKTRKCFSLLTLRMMYVRGTVGKICLIADAKSVKITSALCVEKVQKRAEEEEQKLIQFSNMKMVEVRQMFLSKGHIYKHIDCKLTELKFPASPVVAKE